MKKVIRAFIFLILFFVVSCERSPKMINIAKSRINNDSIFIREYSIDKNNQLIKTNRCYVMGFRIIYGFNDYFYFVFPDVEQKRNYQIGYHIYSNPQSKSIQFQSEEEFELFFESKFQIAIEKRKYEIIVYYKPKMSKAKLDGNFPSYIYINKEFGLLAVRTTNKLSFIEKNTLVKNENYALIMNSLLKVIKTQLGNVPLASTVL